MGARRVLYPVFLLLTGFSAPGFSGEPESADSPASNKLPTLDWVAKEQLTEEQAADCPHACRGAYIAPERTDEDANRPPAESPIRGEADASEIDMDAATALMEGGVVFTQGWRELQSERVEIDRTKGKLELDGNVSIREPGILLVGESASIDSSNDLIVIRDAAYLLHEQRIRGTASSIDRAPSRGLAIHNASYTACEPEDDAWVLYADQIKINEETGRASARGVRMETAGVPFFYTPYFNFTVDGRRATGLLYPSLGYDNNDGIEYSQPVYLNISANQDLTLTANLSSRRGSGLEAEHRLLTRHSFTRSAGAFYPREDLNPEHSDKRWAAAITHRGIFDQGKWGRFGTKVDFAGLSDDDFLEDRATEVVRAGARDVYLRQHAGLSVGLNHWRLSASATDYQNLIDDDREQYRELPKISFDGRYNFDPGLHLDINNEWVRFDRGRDSIPASNSSLAATGKLPGTPPTLQAAGDRTWVTGARTKSNWSLRWDHSTHWGFFNPGVGIHYLAYHLDAPVPGSSDDSPNITVPEASLRAGLNFERETSLFGTAGYQTLEPRVYYLYRNGKPQGDMPVFDTAVATASLEQLFRDSRFVGGDRLEGASRASLGLWSRFYSATSGHELLSLGMGQTYYLRDRTVRPLDPISSTTSAPGTPLSKLLNKRQRDRSDIITEAIWNPSGSLEVKGSIFWNNQQSDLAESRLEFSYRPLTTDRFLKLVYTREDHDLTLRDNNRNGLFESNERVDKDTEQVSVSGQWPLNERWKMLFLWREDLENSRSLNRIAGLGYQSCCWNLSLSWRSELKRVDRGAFIAENPRRDTSIVLHFEFSGLGGLGTSGRNLLEGP